KEEIKRRWLTINKRMVLGPLVTSLSRVILGYLGALVLGKPCPSSVLDTAPLRDSLNNEALIDWKQLRTNLQSGAVEVLAVAATKAGSGRTKIFYQAHDSAKPPPDSDENQAIDYVRTELCGDHVLASAAIPVLFPPVRLKAPDKHRFFLDGGVRLNAPLKPA